MKGARTRQEQLARERIEALKNKRAAKKQQGDESKESVDNNENLESLNDTDDVIKLQVRSYAGRFFFFQQKRL